MSDAIRKRQDAAYAKLAQLAEQALPFPAQIHGIGEPLCPRNELEVAEALEFAVARAEAALEQRRMTV